MHLIWVSAETGIHYIADETQYYVSMQVGHTVRENGMNIRNINSTKTCLKCRKNTIVSN